MTKRAALVTLMETGIKELYARQLTMLCAQAEKNYKASLVKLLEGDTLDEDSEADVLRKVTKQQRFVLFCFFWGGEYAREAARRRTFHRAVPRNPVARGTFHGAILRNPVARKHLNRNAAGSEPDIVTTCVQKTSSLSLCTLLRLSFD